MCKGFRKHIRVWALCLATLFAAYYATTALFTHVHVVNGVMLVHSHPFSHSHSHSDGQTLALHFLSTFSSLEPGHTEVETPDLHLQYIPCRMLLYGRDVPPCSSCTIVLIGNLKNIVLIFLGANNEKIYQFADGSGMRSCQLYYCIR